MNKARKSSRPRPLPRIQVVGAAVLSGQRCLVGRRPQGGSAGDKWEFPGGKVEAGETPERALLRELKEELDVDAQILSYAGRSTFPIPTCIIELTVFFAELVNGEPIAREHTELRWITEQEIEQLDWAEADRPILPTLRKMLREREVASAQG